LNFGIKIAEGVPRDVMTLDEVTSAYLGSEVKTGA
jgi:ABC-type branched-subunit amino acid transport system ATPase component